jgi:hypothetical protein
MILSKQSIFMPYYGGTEENMKLGTFTVVLGDMSLEKACEF